VNRAGDFFLTRSGFPVDQHRGRGWSHMADQVEDVEHVTVLAEHVMKGVLACQLLAQGDDLVLQGSFTQSPFHDQAQMLRVGGLGEEFVGAKLHGLDRFLDAAAARGHDHGHVKPSLLHRLDQFHAVEARHLQIGNDEAVGAIHHCFEGASSIRDSVHFDADTQSQKCL
jgi:hypothetical protein